jgi:hypothetical protein
MSTQEYSERFDPARWLHADARKGYLYTIENDSDLPRLTTADDWLRSFSAARLEPPVPTQITNMFEQARACAAYAFFFYPLYGLAVEHAVRTVDASVKVRCGEFSASSKDYGF